MIIRKLFDVSKGLKAEPGGREVVARISTIAVDREGDVMLPSGIDYKTFMSNPVVLMAHDSYGSLPLGSVPRGGIQKDPSGVTAKVQFAKRPESLPDEAEWMPDTVFEMFQQKVLRAFSVGFTIKDAREAVEADARRFGEGVKRVITKWNLLEFSVVPIPCNQEALALAVSKGFDPCTIAGHLLEKVQPIRLRMPDPIRLPSRLRVGST